MEPHACSGSDGFMLLSRYRRAVMGVAALWILFFHAGYIHFESTPVLSTLERFIKRAGFCGVDVFLCLSGMGLVYAMEKGPSLLTFYAHGIRRLLIPFVGFGLFRGWRDGWSASQMLKNLSGYTFLFENIFAFLWFVPALALFYLVFPLYYRLFRRSSSQGLFTGCALALWLGATLWLRADLRPDLFGVTNRIPIFLTGILLGWLSARRSIRSDRLAWCFLGLILLLGAYLSFLVNFQGMYLLVPDSGSCLPNILMGASLPFLLAGLFWLLAERLPVRLPGRLLCGVLFFFGSISLEFYCVQEWLAGRLLPRLPPELCSFWANLIFQLAAAAAVLLFWLNKGVWAAVDRLLALVRPLSKKDKDKEGAAL